MICKEGNQLKTVETAVQNKEQNKLVSTAISNEICQ
jgi:hypothetical protein